MQYWYSLLKYNRSRVHSFINKVHRATSDFYAIFKCLLLCMKSRKCRQEGRVNVHDSHLIMPYKLLTHYPHKSSKTHKPKLRGDAMLMQSGSYTLVIVPT